MHTLLKSMVLAAGLASTLAFGAGAAQQPADDAVAVSQKNAVGAILARPDVRKWTEAVQLRGGQLSAKIDSDVQGSTVCHLIALGDAKTDSTESKWKVCGDSVEKLPL